jgi:hypothetical protein
MWRDGRERGRHGGPVNRKTWVLAGAAALVAITGTGCALSMSSGKGGTTAAPKPAPNTATVERGKLSSMVSLDGTLTYRAQADGSPYVVINHASGTYTQLPDEGDKVNCGDVLYGVGDHPVLLLCGTLPAHRDLHTGDVGDDVRQLNSNLYTLGYDAKAGVVIDPGDKTFTSSTEKALEALQHGKGFDAGDTDAPALQTQIQQAQATLAGAQAVYDKLSHGPLPEDIGAAAAAVDVAKALLAAAQHAAAGSQTTGQKDTAAAQVAVANAQQAVADAEKNAATIPGIVQQQIEQAKAKLYADQTTWDAQVGRGAVTKEQRQSALDVDQAAIDQVTAAAKQQMVQAQQTANQAQQALKTAQANLDAAQAREAQTVQAAQDEVANAQAALGQAQAGYNKAAARPRKTELDAAAAQVQAQKAAVQLAENNLHAAGELHVADAVFLPGPVRIVKVTAVLGASAAAAGPSQTGTDTTASGGPPAEPGTQVLSATSDTPEVQVQLDPSQQSEVKPGEPAQITLPGTKSVGGKVDRLGKVAQVPSGQDKNAGAATIPAYISLDDPAKAAELDQAPVQVEITTEGLDNALSVPVTALIGKSGGGFAVEVVRPGGARESVAVKLGLFDTGGGRVQVEGDLREGDQVAVPSA